MKNFLKLLAVASVALAPLSQASAASITNLTDYVTSQDAGAVLLSEFNLGGLRDYTAIDNESGHTNTTSLTVNGVATFSTANTAEFGTWKEVNFSTDNIFFNDTTDGNPVNVALNPYAGSDRFQVFQLSQAVTLNEIFFREGSLIIGFGDGLGDSDYDDLIIGVSAVPVPAAAFLFAPALLGFMGLRRKAKKSA